MPKYTAAGKDAARRAVRDHMAMRHMFGGNELAELAGIANDTAVDFLAGRTFPRSDTLAKIQNALGMAPGTAEALAREDIAFLERQAGPSVPEGRVSSGRRASDRHGNTKTVLASLSDAELLLELLSRDVARRGVGGATSSSSCS
jgi:transcriptional regulator with XRE-family HTH domain